MTSEPVPAADYVRYECRWCGTTIRYNVTTSAAEIKPMPWRCCGVWHLPQRQDPHGPDGHYPYWMNGRCFHCGDA